MTAAALLASVAWSVADSGLVSSRKPDNIPAFNSKLIEKFAAQRVA